MKNLSRLMLFMLLAVSFNNVNAQDENNPWQITIGLNAVDEYPSGDGGVFSDAIFDQYFNVAEHWNIMPILSTLSVSRYIDSSISFGITGSINKINYRGDISPGVVNLVNDLTFYSVDGTVKYSFLKPGKTLDPFIGLGGGYTWINKVAGPTANGTLGLNVWVNSNLGLTLQTAYKHSFDEATIADDINTYFHHSIGISIKFGGTDTDGDGIFDRNDACIEVPGILAFNGCPDTDGDGITDAEDNCPNEVGPREFNGCPDTDGDGIIDNDDNCPNVAGLKELAGCPDTDGDGIIDSADECVDVPGPSENKGCPWLDTDGDTVLDKDDACVDVKGTVANNGCPEVTVEIQKTLNEYAKTILFETGKAEIKKESAEVLSDIINILNEYKTSKFTIEGHTDNVGKANKNQQLSDARANSVKVYLIENGIDQFRLSSRGFGQTKPIDTNKTKAGRANNRRVEINLAN